MPVEVGEWFVEPEHDDVPEGQVTFEVHNVGGHTHEFVVVAAEDTDDLQVEDGQVQEDALGEDALVGEIEDIPPGETCAGPFEMAAGEYLLLCNIVEAEPDGAVESHYEEGMVTELEVG